MHYPQPLPTVTTVPTASSVFPANVPQGRRDRNTKTLVGVWPHCQEFAVNEKHSSKWQL